MFFIDYATSSSKKELKCFFCCLNGERSSKSLKMVMLGNFICTKKLSLEIEYTVQGNANYVKYG